MFQEQEWVKFHEREAMVSTPLYKGFNTVTYYYYVKNPMIMCTIYRDDTFTIRKLEIEQMYSLSFKEQIIADDCTC